MRISDWKNSTRYMLQLCIGRQYGRQRRALINWKKVSLLFNQVQHRVEERRGRLSRQPANFGPRHPFPLHAFVWLKIDELIRRLAHFSGHEESNVMLGGVAVNARVVLQGKARRCEARSL